ncbi:MULTISPECIES: DUF1090 domain-containing protein [Dyella]|uniref:DUF1090 domain-containing protein n=1 Tax=Dyella TaxID=231454 RepID=UPI000C85B28B|nr:MULTISPECIES: DUF1090 domain-containing protein [Dyella]MDR3444099.1 DUF1090 domain-containing protein [Dyella sp.]PMQ06361.1 hypothetical protein DyAD56_05120 [Dyella sp. AD56]ULU26251.1 DUF1090 protein [Dyella terrae]
MKTLVRVLVLGSSLFPLFALAQSGGCDAKRASIQQEITYAQAHGNAARVQGLQKALSEVNAHCTDAALRSDAEQKVAKAQQKLADREKELQDAKDQGKSAQKIADRQRKVDDAHAELEQAIVGASP